MTFYRKISLGLTCFVLSLLCAGWIPSCLSPCEKLAQTFCLEVNKMDAKELCQIVREESRQAEQSFRRCGALLEQWGTVGRQHTRLLVAKFKQNRSIISNMKFKMAKTRLEEELLLFRQNYRTLLQYPWPKPEVSTPSKKNTPPKTKTPSSRKQEEDDDDE